MAVRDIFKVSRKTFFNPSAWLDVDSLSANSKNAWGIFKGLFTPATVGEQETFDEAMRRRDISEEEVKQLEQNYFAYAFFFATLGVILIIYGFYLLFHHNTFHGWILALAASTLFFAQAFRFHFWHFQIKHRKL